MCGRFKRKSDKQKVARVFEVQVGLEEADFAPGDDLRPHSMQPVIYLDDHGERRIELMRWGFKLPDRLLFNARSEGIAQGKFWKDVLCCTTCIHGDEDAAAAGANPPGFDEIIQRGEGSFGIRHGRVRHSRVLDCAVSFQPYRCQEAQKSFIAEVDLRDEAMNLRFRLGKKAFESIPERASRRGWIVSNARQPKIRFGELSHRG